MKRAALVLLALASVAGAAPASVTVRPGDTLWSIARAAGLTVEKLMALNGLTTPDLRAGQVLVLAEDDAAPAPTAVPSTSAQAAPPAAIFQKGLAVYYGGKTDAATSLTAAHLDLPFGTLVKVTHQKTGKSVVVKVNDRGPFGRPERVIDLSMDAARALGIISEGVAPVVLEIIDRP
ncbi:septal ring lytic transglycosylase RlpA family protein [Deinococcus pimensis]|uniref:septal ring lytic transglycosylase RlpA family protein n=1 Tax=Deinococcus pimensis TaxID=309888 RepID=UPI0004801FC0|nr:septal ring lytic transglycosylase RlpA family protein [Deinococcus pimensis]